VVKALDQGSALVFGLEVRMLNPIHPHTLLVQPDDRFRQMRAGLVDATRAAEAPEAIGGPQEETRNKDRQCDCEAALDDHSHADASHREELKPRTWSP
jgi:hypothetical protein